MYLFPDPRYDSDLQKPMQMVNDVLVLRSRPITVAVVISVLLHSPAFASAALVIPISI